MNPIGKLKSVPVERLTGMGDTNPQFYFTSHHPASVVWGIARGFTLPTASNPSARTGDWGMGPVAAAIWSEERGALSAIVTQTWTIARDDDGTQINQSTVQPLLHQHFAHAYAISSTPTMKANLEAYPSATNGRSSCFAWTERAPLRPSCLASRGEVGAAAVS